MRKILLFSLLISFSLLYVGVVANMLNPTPTQRILGEGSIYQDQIISGRVQGKAWYRVWILEHHDNMYKIKIDDGMGREIWVNAEEDKENIRLVLNTDENKQCAGSYLKQ